MRSFVFLSMLLASVQIFAAPTLVTPASSVETRDLGGVFDAPVEPRSELTTLGTGTQAAEPRSAKMLNADRLARGLPPAPPTRRKPGFARQAVASPTPQITKRGMIQVTNTDTGEVVGFVQPLRERASFHAYGPESSALIVSFSVNEGATTRSTTDLVPLSGWAIDNWSFFGLVQGFPTSSSVFEPGNPNYAYFAGTRQSPPNSPPVDVGNTWSPFLRIARESESAIWSVDLTTGALTAQWVNPDGSKPVTQTWSRNTVLLAGGDYAAFVQEQADNPAPTFPIAFTFIETA